MVLRSEELSYLDPLESLLAELEPISRRITAGDLLAILERSTLTIENVASHVEPTADTYTRRQLAGSDRFEVLVLTWMPGQGSGAHDHSDSLSGFKILKGTAREAIFASQGDGFVKQTGSCELHEGQVGIDPPGVIHSVCNDAKSPQLLVSLHIYAPPFPAMRHYDVRAHRTLCPSSL